MFRVHSSEIIHPVSYWNILDKLSFERLIIVVKAPDDTFEHKYLDLFKKMMIDDLIQLRIIPAVGAEQFAKFIFEKIDTFVKEETEGRVKVSKVEFMEHDRNTAIYTN